ncbi:serine/threonine-protein kinase BLUS1-like isoform X1 [Gossypium hirsutum]|uniref:Serine/threonine-protein kinase BLUS1-like isoform X1 n=2 Tax=Gossypium hirsutum TaxID=3635 RepID=A0ABM2ZVT8_GOSHI|nr:serine/threonine-protein kinase BLUS1-like isoform X1 [Gossypium hirsutum]
MNGIFRSIFSALHLIYWLLTGFLNAVLQDDIHREAQTMSLIDHSNVIRPYCSFVVDHNLWIVMPFMSEGSCLHLMKSAYLGGFEEPAIGSVLKETLKALDYLHRQGHIYRDVKEIDKVLEIPLLGLLAGWHQRSCSLEVDITPSECSVFT